MLIWSTSMKKHFKTFKNSLKLLFSGNVIFIVLNSVIKIKFSISFLQFCYFNVGFPYTLTLQKGGGGVGINLFWHFSFHFSRGPHASSPTYICDGMRKATYTRTLKKWNYVEPWILTPFWLNLHDTWTLTRAKSGVHYNKFSITY